MFKPELPNQRNVHATGQQRAVQVIIDVKHLRGGDRLLIEIRLRWREMYHPKFARPRHPAAPSPQT
jgi:hypothetical protein